MGIIYINKPRFEPHFYDLYVLELEEGKYYVGITKNFKKRWEQHKNGEGAVWTKKYRPIRVIEHKQLSVCKKAFAETYEDEKTIEMMKRYGVSNVRGGQYCAESLDDVIDRLGEINALRIDLESCKYQAMEAQKIIQSRMAHKPRTARSKVKAKKKTDNITKKNPENRKKAVKNDHSGKVFIVDSKKRKIRSCAV